MISALWLAPALLGFSSAPRRALRENAAEGFEEYARRLASTDKAVPGYVCRQWKMTSFINHTTVNSNPAPSACCQCTCHECKGPPVNSGCICPACDQCNGVTWTQPPYSTFGKSTWTDTTTGERKTERGYFWPLYVTNTQGNTMHKHTFVEMHHPMYMPNNDQNHAESTDGSTLPEYRPGAWMNMGRRSKAGE